MPFRRRFLVFLTLPAVWLTAPSPCRALITSEYPLKQVLKESKYVFLARIEKIDPARPSASLSWSEDLKGKSPWQKLPVLLAGDELKHTPQLLKRLTADLPVVCFVQQEKAGEIVAFGYSNGTWFQLLGHRDGESVRWEFTHCEIYLRRTYQGTTTELKDLLAKVLAGKARPPEYDKTVEPGFGPEVE